MVLVLLLVILISPHLFISFIRVSIHSFINALTVKGLDQSATPVYCQGCILLPDPPASTSSTIPQRTIDLNDGDIIAIDWSYDSIQEVKMLAYTYVCVCIYVCMYV